MFRFIQDQLLLKSFSFGRFTLKSPFWDSFCLRLSLHIARAVGLKWITLWGLINEHRFRFSTE